jgi:hypothetical protein
LANVTKTQKFQRKQQKNPEALSASGLVYRYSGEPDPYGRSQIMLIIPARTGPAAVEDIALLQKLAMESWFTPV